MPREKLETPLQYNGTPIGTIYHFYRLLNPDKFDANRFRHQVVSAIIDNIQHIYGNFGPFEMYDGLTLFLTYSMVEEESLDNLRRALRRLDSLDVTEWINWAIDKPYSYLPSQKDGKVYVFPWIVGDKKARRSKIIPGYNASGGIIFLLNPVRGTKRKLKHAAAHEYAHKLRNDKLGPQDNYTVLDRVVDEGLAENFVVELYPEKSSVATEILKDDEIDATWKLCMPLLNSRKPVPELMYGGNHYLGRFKPGTGYALGYELVRDALARNGRKVRDIIFLDAKEIVEISRFSI